MSIPALVAKGNHCPTSFSDGFTVPLLGPLTTKQAKWSMRFRLWPLLQLEIYHVIAPCCSDMGILDQEHHKSQGSKLVNVSHRGSITSWGSNSSSAIKERPPAVFSTLQSGQRLCQGSQETLSQIGLWPSYPSFHSWPVVSICQCWERKVVKSNRPCSVALQCWKAGSPALFQASFSWTCNLQHPNWWNAFIVHSYNVAA